MGDEEAWVEGILCGGGFRGWDSCGLKGFLGIRLLHDIMISRFFIHGQMEVT